MADAPAISLSPDTTLQIKAYFSERDVASIKAGEHSDITLDAYGSDRVFSASVVSVDRSPTMQNGVPAYGVTLQFDANDQAISAGMTANISLPLSQ